MGKTSWKVKEMQEVIVQKQALLVFRNLQGTEKGNLQSLLQKYSNSDKTMEREAEETELLKEKRKENMTGRRSKDAQIRLERQS